MVITTTSVSIIICLLYNVVHVAADDNSIQDYWVVYNLIFFSSCCLLVCCRLCWRFCCSATEGAPVPIYTVVPTNENSRVDSNPNNCNYGAIVTIIPASPVSPLGDALADKTVICYKCNERDKNTLLDCGHTLCSVCADGAAFCPFCKGPIKNRRRIFL